MNKTIWFGDTADTPLGLVWVAKSETGLWAVEYAVSQGEFELRIKDRGGTRVVYNKDKVKNELDQVNEYLERKRKSFDIPIDWNGMTTFQESTLKKVAEIPYGKSRTYGEIAMELGKAGGARAVGLANANNPMPLVIPCHRVIGADGSLRGYGGSGGVTTKAWLLDLESGQLSMNLA